MLETAQPLFASSQTRRYRGGCQCGCVVYEASLDLARAHDAAPSVWERRVRSFKLVRGEDMLRGYQFSDAGVHHFYCDRCGARAFSHVSSPQCGDFYSVDLKSLHVVGTPAHDAPTTSA
jgi:hypothetical protein